ncbi:MAG: hypothetical protein SFX73_02555 [Kofleriaceae bacterium]|nr:hypothetical protein [Kofleriaceae bacterium]
MRVRASLLAVIAATTVAEAQPADPYGPTPAPAPPAPAPMPPLPAGEDPVLAEQIAQSLVVRAQELLDARLFADARQLANEALAKSPNGTAAQQATFILQEIDKALGLTKPAPPPEPVDLTPIKDLTEPTQPLPPQPEAPTPATGDKVLAARVHAGLYGGLLGATIGAFFSEDTPAGGAVPLGIALAAGGAYAGPKLFGKLDWDEAQIRTLGMGSVWGGVIGGFLGDAVSVDNSSSRSVLVGASIGSTVLGLAGAGLASKHKLTRGDVALMDTMAGIGAVGGLTLGLLMQPAEGEAYSVNAILGTGAGLLVGYVAAPSTNTTPRRMLRVAGLAAAGAAIPFALYGAIHDSESTGDDRAVGTLSTIGLVAGAYLGFRLTRGMDAGLDVPEGNAAKVDDAPPAVVGRHSDGRWALGSLAVQPLSPALAPQPGMAMPLVGGTF